MTQLGHWISPLVVGVAAIVVIVMMIDRMGHVKRADAPGMSPEQSRAWMKSHALIDRHPRVFLAALTLFVVMLLIGPKHWPLY